MDAATLQGLDAVSARINAVLAAPATTYRMARILREWLNADAVDALHEARFLAALMKDRADAVLSD